jgi:hypothetical protein
MRISRIWVLLIASLVFFLIANAPAQILKPYLKNSFNFPFTLSGSIWNGSLQSEYFNKASWQVHPLSLLLLKISIDIKVEIDSKNKLNANAEMNPFNTLELNNINGVLTSQYLQQFLPSTPLLFSSNINIDQTNAKWSSQLPPNTPSEAGGSLTFEKVNFLGENLGNYRLNFVYFDRSLSGDISSTDSSAVEASIKLNISNSNLLTLDGEIFPKTKGLQSIFRELNISFTPNITLQLNF